jgi:hypothetical protein
MIKASSNLQDLRWKIYIKGKTEKFGEIALPSAGRGGVSISVKWN